MLQKIKLVIYYMLVSKLPHSRLSSLSNKLRFFYVSRILGIIEMDKNSKFENNIYISDGMDVKIGLYARINENVFLQGNIKIGNYVMLAPNVAIHSSTHIYDNPTVPMVTCGLTENKEVIIEDDVWIGRNAIILPGIRIGKGSIIGANTLVNKDIEPYSIMGGVPAKLIKKRI